MTRLNKFLASCGVGSRRACDELILEGRVEINGQPCLTPGVTVGPDDSVRVDGKRVRAHKTTTILFNKPRGLVCTKDDEKNRDTIYGLLPPALQHLNHVGRLDRESEGLLILTNDGDLAQKLMHPSKKVEKEYYVTANQSFENETLDNFLRGIYTPEGKLKAKTLRRQSARRVQMVLETGAKRQIRLMFKAMGMEVMKLVRVRIGSLWGGDLEQGRWRFMSDEDIALAMTNPKDPKGKQVYDAPKRDTKGNLLHKNQKPRGSAAGPATKAKRTPSDREEDPFAAPARPARSTGRTPSKSTGKPARKSATKRAATGSSKGFGTKSSNPKGGRNSSSKPGRPATGKATGKPAARRGAASPSRTGKPLRKPRR